MANCTDADASMDAEGLAAEEPLQTCETSQQTQCVPKPIPLEDSPIMPTSSDEIEVASGRQQQQPVSGTSAPSPDLASNGELANCTDAPMDAKGEQASCTDASMDAKGELANCTDASMDAKGELANCTDAS